MLLHCDDDELIAYLAANYTSDGSGYITHIASQKVYPFPNQYEFKGHYSIWIRLDDAAIPGFAVDLSRVVYALHHRVWPRRIKHLDGDPTNRNISNLVNMTKASPALGNGRRYFGVQPYANHAACPWRVQVNYGGKSITLGYYADQEFAAKICDSACAYLGKPRRNFPSEAVPLPYAETRKCDGLRAAFLAKQAGG